MREIGVLEAKTSFTRLIAEVERTGEPVTVTRHGRAAVRIVPVQAPVTRTPEERRVIARQVFAARDARATVSGFDDLPWEELKKLMRNEDRYD